MKRNAYIRLLPLATVVIQAACLSQESAFSEESLLQYATTPYDKGAQTRSHQILGKLNDVDVVADFVCSDVCPDYTVRIIHFDVEPGEGCDAIGGVVKTVIVPVAIAAAPKDFCFPKVLADNWDAYVR